MLKNGIISPMVSDYTSSLVLVTKKDGSIRVCVDLRQINAITEDMNYALPLADDIFDAVANANSCWYTTLDLASAYWQIRVAELSRKYLCFQTVFGSYAFNYMPFGAKNAGLYFQRLMDMVMKGLMWKCCSVFIDDLLIFSTNFEQHLEQLQEVFDRLRQAGLKLKPKKCAFGQEEVEFLGHVITDRGIKPNPKRIEIIKNYPVPQNIKQLRSALGLFGYYRVYVPNFSIIAKVLHNLVK